MKKILLGLSLFALLLFLKLAWSAETEVMKSVKAGNWDIMIHLNSIPTEHREMAKATHHVSFTVTDEKGVQITDAKVKFEFVREGKIVTSGEAKYMGAMAMGGHAMQGGHYGADITLPGGGVYTVNVTVTAKLTTRKVSTQINAPE